MNVRKQATIERRTRRRARGGSPPPESRDAGSVVSQQRSFANFCILREMKHRALARPTRMMILPPVPLSVCAQGPPTPPDQVCSAAEPACGKSSRRLFFCHPCAGGTPVFSVLREGVQPARAGSRRPVKKNSTRTIPRHSPPHLGRGATMPRKSLSRVVATLREIYGSDAVLRLYGTPLCNFSPHSFVYRGRRVPTVEHGFQSMKTSVKSLRAKIIAARTPALAKSLGRRVPLRDGWEAMRPRIMLECLTAKIEQNKDVRDYLMQTGCRTIVEAGAANDSAGLSLVASVQTTEIRASPQSKSRVCANRQSKSRVCANRQSKSRVCANR